ncbi:MAG: WXG100 family type VII secretion target [Chloroflexota bacterium]
MSDLLLRSELLREAATRFNLLGSETEQMQRQIEAAWHRLEGGWEDYAETGLTGYYSETMGEISRMAAMLRQMAEVLERVADLLEQTDASSATVFGDLGTDASQGAAPLPLSNSFPTFPPGAQIDDPHWWLQFQSWLNQLDPQTATLLLPILLGMLPASEEGASVGNGDETPWWAPIVFGLADGWNWYHQDVNQPTYSADVPAE